MTYNVFGGTLNLAQSINHSARGVTFRKQLVKIPKSWQRVPIVVTCRISVIDYLRLIIF